VTEKPDYNDGAIPKTGHVYTISNSSGPADRSEIVLFWEVLFVNGPKAYVKIHKAYDRPVLRLVRIKSYAWHLADAEWEILKQHIEPRPG
jgi:hypothetical protein